MKKQIIIFLLIISTSNSLLHSQAPAIEWQKVIGGDLDDMMVSIGQTNDGGFVFGGLTSSPVSGDIEASDGLNDYMIVKTDATGNIEWQNTLGGLKEDDLTILRQTTDGGYILGGSSRSKHSDDKSENSIIYDYWIVKLDATGNIIWDKTMGGDNWDYCQDITETPDGGFIVAGYSTSGISGEVSETGYGGDDWWVLKLDASGNIVWDKKYGGASSDFLFSIAPATDGGYVMLGWSSSPVSGNKTEASISSDYWVVKIDDAGNIVWQNTIGGNLWDYGYSISPTDDGGYILGGVSQSGIYGDHSELNVDASGAFDYWVVKINIMGNVEWDNNIGAIGNDYLYDVKQTSDGGYILAGESTSVLVSGEKTEPSFGSYDIWVIRLNNTGDILWQKVLGGSLADRFYFSEIMQTNDGGYMIGGSSGSGISGNKTLPSKGSIDYWMVKLAADGCVATPEICNTLDDNCNGLIDDGISETIIINADGPTTFCQGTTVLLSATYSGATIQWKKNGAPIPGATSLNYVVNKSGNYSATTTSPCGNATSTTVAVTVNKNPNASISAAGPTTFCAGGSVLLTEIAVAGCTYQWYKGANPIVGATSLTYSATTSGNYKCRVTKAATGCYKNSNAIAVSVTCKEGLPAGEAGELMESEIHIYPNPSQGYFEISSPTIIRKVEIINSLGQLVYSVFAQDSLLTINLSEVAIGLYVIRIQSDFGIVEEQLMIKN